MVVAKAAALLLAGLLAVQAGSPPPPSGAEADGSEEPSIERRLRAVESRLDRLEGRCEAQEKLRRTVESMQEELRRLSRRQRATEGASAESCTRSEGTYAGRREILVAVGGVALRFLEIEPPAEPIAIGLSEERARELLREVQGHSEAPILPWIFRSVPAVSARVPPFFLQDRLIDPRLFARFTGGARADEVSFDQARRFIAELNARCSGRARFELPSEAQFVAAARLVYDPLAHGLAPCSAVRKAGSAVELTQLLGHTWQLTRSFCVPLGADHPIDCEADFHVRKGGAETSTDPLECMPEYRSAAPPDVAQKETSFRLVLVDG
jgi:hypothetical protein